MIMNDGGSSENIVLQTSTYHIRLRVREQHRLYFIPWLMKPTTFGVSVNYKDLVWCDGY